MFGLCMCVGVGAFCVVYGEALRTCMFECLCDLCVLCASV